MAYFFADYAFAAKYPFSQRAKEIMREQTVEISDYVAEAGFERLSSALRGETRRKMFVHEQDAIDEILAYAASRMLLMHMRNSFLTNRYAVSEAKKAFAYLESESDENVSALASDMGLDSFKKEGGRITVDVAHFLLYSPKDVHYKLISREINHGQVAITEHERVRLIEEAVKKYMEKLPPQQAVPQSIKKTAEKLKALLPKIEPQQVSFKEGENPPCIEGLLDMMRKHENVGHTGRWLLAVYLINRGMSTSDMLKIYSNSPDYNQKTTAYQIEHARKRGYKMPNCASVLTYGYCVSSCGITNPMGWRKRAQPRQPQGQQGKPGETAKSSNPATKEKDGAPVQNPEKGDAKNG